MSHSLPNSSEKESGQANESHHFFADSNDRFREECGLMAVWGHPEAANICYLGLFAQQHRGQEGAGVVSLGSASAQGSSALGVAQPLQLHTHRGLGLVADVFEGFDFERLPGESAIGHVRYTTAGGNLLSNVQPLRADISVGPVAVAHNGNLINTDVLKDELIRSGAIFNSTADTEVLLHLMARAPRKHADREVYVREAVIETLKQIKGAYSVLILFEDRLFAARDPNGFRPLCLGTLDGAAVIASETCAFDLVGADYVRDLAPGEVLEISLSGHQRSVFPFGPARESPCVFEYIYFARPDSRVFGRSVYAVRRELGVELAREHPVAADLVIPVPDSGMTAALGYSVEAGIPLELGLIRNHYVGRTFIEPKQSIRDFGVKIKHNPNPEVLRDKSVVVIDDSIVRGTTSRKLVAMLRRAGARELHMRISAPPTIDPCYYGIDTPQKEELLAARMSLEEIKEFLEVDSVAYLSVEGMYRAVERCGQGAEGHSRENAERVGRGRGFCDACFTGLYPIGTPASFAKKQAELL